MPRSAISEAREAVLRRDNWTCVATSLDPDAGPCFDAWGHPFGGYDPTGIRLEVDRVQPEPGSRKVTHLDVDSMYAACPGHHRGTGPNRGYVWALAHREELREYLSITMPGLRSALPPIGRDGYEDRGPGSLSEWCFDCESYSCAAPKPVGWEHSA